MLNIIITDTNFPCLKQDLKPKYRELHEMTYSNPFGTNLYTTQGLKEVASKQKVTNILDNHANYLINSFPHHAERILGKKLKIIVTNNYIKNS